MSEGKTRCIVGAGLLWGATLAAAHIEQLSFRLYLAVLVATALATVAAFAWVIGAKFWGVQGRRDEETKVMVHGAVSRIEEATRVHAHRMETATARHGDQLGKLAFRADQWFCNGMTAVKIAREDAVLDVARTCDDGGPLRIINGRG